jgi:hypothetical protein
MDDLLPWAWAAERLTTARNFWLTTVRADGRPNARPVWGTWDEHGFSFSTGGRAGADVVNNPACTVHLEDGWECVIVEGRAEIVTDPNVREEFCIAYNHKYDWSLHLTRAGVGDDAGAEGPLLRIQPEVAYGWPGDLARATRWRW